MWFIHGTKNKFLADLVTFTEEIPNGKLHFLCSNTILFQMGSLEIFV